MNATTADSTIPALRTPRGAFVVLALTFVAALATWSRLEGYQLADSVEYMERAQAMVRGEALVDATAIRSYGFVSVLAPIFLVADWFGVEDFKGVVALVRLLQVLLGLELVRVCIRIGARVAGDRAGLLAGCVVGLNPVFLQFAVSPVSGMAAAVCIAHGLALTLERGSTRRAFGAGLWFGGAILMAYQTILVAAAVGVAIFLRDRWKHRRVWLATAGGIGVGVFVAAALDRVFYGRWGESLILYFGQNFWLILARIPNELGFTQLARDIWGMGAKYFEAETGAHQESTGGDVRQKQTVFYYLVNLPQVFAWPFLAVLAGGFGVGIARRRWREALAVIALVLCVVIMSYKGSKDFRLWLPLLPLVGVFAALGWSALLGPDAGAQRAPRAAIAMTLLALGAVFSWSNLAERETRRYSAYWRAMARVDELAEERGRDLRVASAWHWAVYLRGSAGVDLVKLPHQIDRWPAEGVEPKKSDLDEAQRAADLAALGELDVFITHMGVLMGRPELFALFATEFEVEGVFLDPTDDSRTRRLVLVFARPAEGAERGFVLFDDATDVDVDAYAARHGLGDPLRLVQDPRNARPDELVLLGVSLEPIPGDGHHWLTWHWQVRSPLTENYMLFEELGVPGEAARWMWTRPAGHGVVPSSQWPVGHVIRDGWPAFLSAEALNPAAAWVPLGAESGPEGPRVLELWARFGTLHPEKGFLNPLWPAQPGMKVPFGSDARGEDGRTPDGRRFDERDYLLVETFPLPADDAAAR